MADGRATPESHADISDEARLAEIVDVVIAIASNDFSKRAAVGDGRNLMDGLATGVNMLAEEVEIQQKRERAYQQQMIRTERLAAIGQLAAGVAHEVNNPASFILLNLTTLEELLDRLEASISTPSLKAVVEQARTITRENVRGIDRIATIVSGLRNFSRIEDHSLEALDLDDIIDDACRLVQAEVAYRAHLIVRRDKDLRVRGSRTKLTQVLTNLLINAAQAIPEGAPETNEVTITAAERDGRIFITVSDTGIGMSAEAQARLFEPFFTTKAREQGTGLGLAISATIVRQHGGELRLVRTSDVGTVFEVVLSPAGPAVPITARPQAPAPARRAKVLLIDDEEQLLVAFRRLFATEYDLTTALGGHVALEILERDGEWDAVVCDLMMSDLDGTAVLEWVRAHRPALVDRLIFCTGGAFTPRGYAFADLMGDRLLQKPLFPDQLREAIEQVRPKAPGQD